LGAVAARTLFVSKGIGITRASPPPMSTDFVPRPKRAHQACRRVGRAHYCARPPQNRTGGFHRIRLKQACEDALSQTPYVLLDGLPVDRRPFGGFVPGRPAPCAIGLSGKARGGVDGA